MSLHATVYDIYTDDLVSMVSIERSDTVIISRASILSDTYHDMNIVYCENTTCRQKTISDLQHRFRTNGISVITIH